MPAKKTTKKVAPKKTSKAASKKVTKKKTVKRVSEKNTAKPVKKVVGTKKVEASSTMPMPLPKVETKKILWALLALVTLAFVYFVKDEVIVASVNGKAVSRLALIKNLEKQGASQVLQDMTMKILIEQKIKEAGVKVEQSEIDEEIEKVAEMLEAQGQSLDDLLAAQNLSRKEVEDQLRLTKGMEAVLADRVEVTAEEVESYFEDNKDLLGATADLEEMRTQIEEQLRQQKLSEAQQIWLEEIKAESNIRYFKFEPKTNLSL